MANEKRLIDANACPCIKCDHLGNCRPGLCEAFAKWWLTPVDAVEVVHGKWIPTYKVDWWMGTQDIDGFTCNQCARHFKSKLRLNYCPNCGAKMDGDGNG